MALRRILFNNSRILVLDLHSQIPILTSLRVYRTMKCLYYIIVLLICTSLDMYILGMGPGMSQPSGMGSQYGYPQMQQHMTVQSQYVQAAVAIAQQQSMQPQQVQAASQSGSHAGSDGALPAAPPAYMAASLPTGWAAQSQQPGQPSHYAAVSLAQSSIGQPIQPQQVGLPGIIFSIFFSFQSFQLFCFEYFIAANELPVSSRTSALRCEWLVSRQSADAAAGRHAGRAYSAGAARPRAAGACAAADSVSADERRLRV